LVGFKPVSRIFSPISVDLVESSLGNEYCYFNLEWFVSSALEGAWVFLDRLKRGFLKEGGC